MSENDTNHRLNGLLIDLEKSLLQYVGECWPWTSAHGRSIREDVQELVARQQSDATRLAQFLIERDHPLESGAYPTEYTRLHYTALAFLLGELDRNQSAIASRVQAVAGSELNGAGADLVNEISTSEQQIQTRLRELASQARSSIVDHE